MDVILIELPDLGGLLLTQAFLVAFDLTVNVIDSLLNDRCKIIRF